MPVENESREETWVCRFYVALALILSRTQVELPNMKRAIHFHRRLVLPGPMWWEIIILADILILNLVFRYVLRIQLEPYLGFDIGVPFLLTFACLLAGCIGI